jgi:hypothetical protein
VDKLGKVLPRVIARQPHSAILGEHRVRLALAEVLGQLASLCQTVELRGSTLVIATSDAALAHELRLEAEDLVRRVNERSMVPRRIRAIQVRVGRSR